MKSILLIGAGQLGSRHLQALKSLKTACEIFVVDPSNESLATAKDRYDERAGEVVHDLVFCNTISEINKSDIDFSILSTNSKSRYHAYITAISKFRIKHIIFEKVLFQNLAHLELVKDSLAENNITAWVNCPLRISPFYKYIESKYIVKDKPIEFNYSGGEWVGLGCNSIHYLDVLAFLAGDELEAVVTTRLDKFISKSKREGFIEFTGTLKGLFSRGSCLNFSSIRGSDAGSKIIIRQEKLEIFFNEITGSYQVFLAGDLIDDGCLSIPFQSDLTNMIIDEINLTKSCLLPTYDASAQMHQKLLASLLGFYNTIENTNGNTINIT